MKPISIILVIASVLIGLGCSKSPPTQSNDPPAFTITNEHAYKAAKKFLIGECKFLTTGRWNDPWIALLDDTTWRFVGSIGYVVVDGDLIKYLYSYDVAVVYIGNGRTIPMLTDWQCVYIFLNRACRWPSL